MRKTKLALVAALFLAAVCGVLPSAGSVTKARLGDLTRNSQVVTDLYLGTNDISAAIAGLLTTNISVRIENNAKRINGLYVTTAFLSLSNKINRAKIDGISGIVSAQAMQISNLNVRVREYAPYDAYRTLTQRTPSLRLTDGVGLGFAVLCRNNCYYDLRDTLRTGTDSHGNPWPVMEYSLTNLYGRTFTTNYLHGLFGRDIIWTNGLTATASNVGRPLSAVCGGIGYPPCYGREAVVRELLCDILASDPTTWRNDAAAAGQGNKTVNFSGLSQTIGAAMTYARYARSENAQLRHDYESGPAFGTPLLSYVRRVMSGSPASVSISPDTVDLLEVSNAVSVVEIKPQMPSPAADDKRTLSCSAVIHVGRDTTVRVRAQSWDVFVGNRTFVAKSGYHLLEIDRIAAPDGANPTYCARLTALDYQLLPPDYTTNNVALVSMVSNYVAKSVVERQLPGDYYNVSNKAYAAQMALPYTLVTNYYHMLPPVISTNYTVAVRDATWADHATAAVRADVADAADWLEDETNTIYAAGDWVVITNVLTGASVTNRLATTKYVDAAVAGIQPGVPTGVSTSAVNAIIAEAVRTNWLITAHAAATNAEYQATNEAQKVKNWTTQNFRPSTWTPGPAAVGALPDSFVALTNKPNFRNGVTSIVTQDYIMDDLGFYYTGEDIDQSFDDTFNYIDDQVGTRLAKNGKIYLNQVTNASGTTITAADLHALPDNSTTSLTGNAHFSAAVRQLSPAMGKVSMTMVTNAQGKAISAGDLGAISRNDVYNMTNRFLQRAWVTYEDEILMTNVISEVATGRRLQSFGTDGRTEGTLYLTTDRVTLPGTPWWEDYRGGVSLIGNDEYIGLGFGRFTEGDPYPDSYTTFYGNEFIECKGKYVVLPGGEPISGYDTFAVVSDIGKNRALGVHGPVARFDSDLDYYVATSNRAAWSLWRRATGTTVTLTWDPQYERYGASNGSVLLSGQNGVPTLTSVLAPVTTYTRTDPAAWSNDLTSIVFYNNYLVVATATRAKAYDVSYTNRLGRLALTNDIPNVPAWALADNPPASMTGNAVVLTNIAGTTSLKTKDGTAVTAAHVDALSTGSRISDWPADIESGGANYTASAKLVRDKALQKDKLISTWPADIASAAATYVPSAKLLTDHFVRTNSSAYVKAVSAGGNALAFTLGDGSTVDYSPSFEMSYPSTMVFKDPASSKISFWSAGSIAPSMLGVFVSKPGSTYANMDKEAIYYAGTPTMANDEKRKYYFWDGYHYTRVADADNLGIFMGPPLDYADAEVGHVYMADAGYTFMQPTTNAADKTRFYLWDGTRYTTVADAADYTDVVRTARTVNGYPLSTNVQLQASDVGATTRAESDARYGSQFAEATADLQGGVRLGRGLYPVLHQNSMSVKYYTKYRACNLKIGSTSHPCYISEYDAQNYNTSGIGAIYQSVGTYPNEYMQPLQGARVVVSGTVPMDITVYFGTTAYELEIGSATLQSENACRVVEPSIFEAFSTTRGYAYGQTCLKDGKLYRCIISDYYSGKTWNASYWSEIKEEPTNGVTATDGELYANGASLTVNSRLEGLASHKQNIIQINTPAGMNEEARTFDDFIQYTGTTTASFKQGHFYRMVTYSPRVWQEVETMDAYTKTDTDSAITSGIRTVLSSRVFDFQGGTNFAQRLYTTLTNIIDILGGSVTNTPSF